MGLRLKYLKGLFSAKPLAPQQHALVVQGLAFVEQCLPKSGELLALLRRCLASGQLRANDIPARAFCKEIPLLTPTIEINFELLCPQSFRAQEQRAKLNALEEAGDLSPERAAQKLAWVDSREREILLDLACLLVHEGTHLLEGRTWSRQADEEKAYRAEQAFLRAAGRRDGYTSLSEARLKVLVEDARLEGVLLGLHADGTV